MTNILSAALLGAGLILSNAQAHAQGWYGINVATSQCDSLDTYAFHSPVEFMEYARSQGDLTVAKIEPNNPMGTWVEIQVIPPSGPQYTVSLIRPYGDCEAILNYQIQQGALPDPNLLK